MTGNLLETFAECQRAEMTHVAVTPLEVVVHVGYRHVTGPQEVVQLNVSDVPLRHLNVSVRHLRIAKEIGERLDIVWVVAVTWMVAEPVLIIVRVGLQSPQVPESSRRKRQGKDPEMKRE